MLMWSTCLCIVSHDVTSARSGLELASSLHHTNHSSQLIFPNTPQVGHSRFLSFFLLASAAPSIPLRSPSGWLYELILQSFICCVPEEEADYKRCSDPAQTCTAPARKAYETGSTAKGVCTGWCLNQTQLSVSWISASETSILVSVLLCSCIIQFRQKRRDQCGSMIVFCSRASSDLPSEV